MKATALNPYHSVIIQGDDSTPQPQGVPIPPRQGHATPIPQILHADYLHADSHLALNTPHSHQEIQTMTLSNNRQTEIVSAFAAAIADLVLDAVEDAVADATDDLLAGGEDMIETSLDDEENREDTEADSEGHEADTADLSDDNALADMILNRVLDMLRLRRDLAPDWAILRQAFPPSPL